MLSNSHSLGDILYRKHQIYQNNSNNKNSLYNDEFEIEKYIISGSSFGGPIALTNKDDCDKFIFIYTSAGEKLVQIDYNSNNNNSSKQSYDILNMGWSTSEHLVVISQKGNVRIYDIHGKIIQQFELLKTTSINTTSSEGSSINNPKQSEMKEQNADVTFVTCQFWGNGVAVMSSDSVIYIAEGFTINELNQKTQRIYTLNTGLSSGSNSDRTFTCMSVIAPLYTKSGFLEVIVGTSDHSALVIYESDDKNVVEDQLLQHKLDAPIINMAVSPYGKFLACYRNDGWLTVLSSNFTTKILDFDVKSVSGPIEIAWCGEDSVVMHWRNTGVLMVGPYGHWLNFAYDSQVHLIPEPDSCRIVSTNGYEILQRISECVVSIRSVGSTDPAALMFDAMEAFEEGDSKSDENIRSLATSNQLIEAVHSCIQAAADEFDITSQQSFLRAASYGKAFCPDIDPTEFVTTALKLRVLNDLRKLSIGLPLTMQQFNTLTPEVVVNRLAMRNQHFLALKICDLLKINNQISVLTHWSCEKICKLIATTPSITDEQIFQILQKQLLVHNKDVSYLSIAEVAYGMKRKKLATQLLEKESNPNAQIPLLLKMNEEELALQIAIQSTDTELIYFTLISLDKRLNSNNNSTNSNLFHRIICSHQESVELLKLYYKYQNGKYLYNAMISSSTTTTNNNNNNNTHNTSITTASSYNMYNYIKLQQLLTYQKNYVEAGNINLLSALTIDASLVHKTTQFKGAIHLYNQCKDTFYKAMIDDQLDIQRNLEIRCQVKTSFMNLSIIQTLKKLILLTIEQPIESRWTEQEILKIMKKFKITEKSYYYLKIYCYSEKKEWNLLNKFANEKKSPIGYKPFAVACIEQNQSISEIEYYMEKITSLDIKYELYKDLKLYNKAIDVAMKQKDAYKLQEIGKVCKDPSLERYIHELISKII